jgi:small nuclear ribonucleoprotein (snRNP)-like protein
MTEHVAAASAIAAAKSKLQAVATMRGLLQSTLRVTLSDGRVVTGKYQCLDEHLNFILQGATERRVVGERAGVEGSVDRQEVRNLGLVMLPGKHMIKVEIKEIGRDPLEIRRAGREEGSGVP